MKKNPFTVLALVTAIAMGGCAAYPGVQSERQFLEASDLDPEFAASILLDMSSEELAESLANGDVTITLSDVEVAGSTVYAIEDASGTITYAAMSILESGDEDLLNIRFARGADDLFACGDEPTEPEEVFAAPAFDGLYENLDETGSIEFNWDATALDRFRDWTNDPSRTDIVVKIVCVTNWGCRNPWSGEPKTTYHIILGGLGAGAGAFL